LGKCLLACDVLHDVVLEAEDKLSLREVEMRQIESVKVFGKVTEKSCSLKLTLSGHTFNSLSI